MREPNSVRSARAVFVAQYSSSSPDGTSLGWPDLPWHATDTVDPGAYELHVGRSRHCRRRPLQEEPRLEHRKQYADHAGGSGEEPGRAAS